MFKVLFVAFWILFFVVAFRYVYVNIIQDMLRKELEDESKKK